jgi:uncharacterized protein YdgA (DUF945 family)
MESLMKKVLVALLVAVVVCVAAAPYVNGLMMEKLLHKQLQRVEQIYGENPFSPQIQILSYERGYLSTEIEWSISTPQIGAVNEAVPVFLVEKAKHGLFGVSSTTSFDQNSWFSEFVEDDLAGENPFSITTDYSLFSGASVAVTVDAFELTLEEGELLVVSPAELVVETDSQLKSVAMHGHADGFAILGLDVRGIDLDVDMQLISSLISEGESTIAVEQVVVTDDTEDFAVTLSGLENTSIIDFDETANKLSVATRYSANQIIAEDETIKDLNFSISLDQLDVEALENIYSLYLDSADAILETLQAGDEGPSDQAQFEMAMLGMSLIPEVENLLQKDLGIAIKDVHLSFPDGEIDGMISIALKKNMTFAGFVALASDPQQLVDVFSFTSNVTIPDGLIPNQADLLLPMFPGMQGGLFEMGEGVLTHKAEIKDEKLFLNDKEFALQW